MKELWFMWKLCKLFKQNRDSWLIDFIGDNTTNELELATQATIQQDKGINRELLKRSFVHYDNTHLRADPNRVIANRESAIKGIGAESILQNCINPKFGFITEDKEKRVVYLTTDGELFISPPNFIWIPTLGWVNAGLVRWWLKELRPIAEELGVWKQTGIGAAIGAIIVWIVSMIS